MQRFRLAWHAAGCPPHCRTECLPGFQGKQARTPRPHPPPTLKQLTQTALEGVTPHVRHLQCKKNKHMLWLHLPAPTTLGTQRRAAQVKVCLGRRLDSQPNTGSMVRSSSSCRRTCTRWCLPSTQRCRARRRRPAAPAADNPASSHTRAARTAAAPLPAGDGKGLRQRLADGQKMCCRSVRCPVAVTGAQARRAALPAGVSGGRAFPPSAPRPWETGAPPIAVPHALAHPAALPGASPPLRSTAAPWAPPCQTPPPSRAAQVGLEGACPP